MTNFCVAWRKYCCSNPSGSNFNNDYFIL